MFKIRLPLIHEEALDASTPRVATPDAKPVNATARRVLIVDDNVDSAVTLSWLLGEHGYIVEVAHDGTSGLKAAQTFKPDILLLDIGLPGINGYELARRLRADGFDSAHMVAISGYAHESDIEKSRAAGFDRHLAKPVDLDHLILSLAKS